jgi:hypothetical protein
METKVDSAFATALYTTSSTGGCQQQHIASTTSSTLLQPYVSIGGVPHFAA